VELQFDPSQVYQLEAIASVVDAFEGAGPASSEVVVDDASLFATVANALNLGEEEMLANIQTVQDRNGLPADERLRSIAEVVPTREGDREWTFPNLSVEMETGTGKTYIYIRTALELFQRYGLRKFIVVVPTIAIRAGVLKTFAVTRKHLAEVYSGVPYAFYSYDSTAPGTVRQFALSDAVEFMVMTLDSFNKSQNLIHRPSDRLQGDSPVELIQATRPVLILDEPQNMGTALATRALARLTPSAALRYSATHRDIFNLVYRLSPFDAYRLGLVKQIEVAGVERDTNANAPYLEIDSIRASTRSVTAKVKVHVLRAGGGIRTKTLTVRSGDSLEEKTERPEYSGLVVDEINPGTSSLRFSNNVELAVGEARGDNRAALFASQIRYAIREHFLKQARLGEHGIKVLTLFFVDRVANYDGPEPLIREQFDAAFNELRTDFPGWNDLEPASVRAAYFAQKTRRNGRVELLDTRTATTDEDRAAFDLIMNAKERLLSFEEPVAFIFSHSALREGWDNPNVSQICTLNQSVSSMRKRQEIGRGMRLVVDQSGRRVLLPELNVLTVVANESYERYVEQYQQEVVDDYGDAEAGTRVRNARQRQPVFIREELLRSDPFTSLWNAIRRATEYSVRVDTDQLLDAVVPEIDRSGVDRLRVRVAKGRLVAGESMFDRQTVAGPRTVAVSDAGATASDVVETMSHLLASGNPPLCLTRRTLLELFRRCETKDIALANPHGWATVATHLVREHLAEQLIAQIEYTPSGETFDVSEFEPAVDSWSDRTVPVTRSLYDHVVVDSDVERRFVVALDKDERTNCYVKLPRWFTVRTPIGQYNPDWAISRELRDEHGRVESTLQLVAETKGSLDTSGLRPQERRKVMCGKAHFGSLGVRFDVVRSLTDLDLQDDVEAPA
jgi:type III restriction enzyme